jgi:hypothetical protein
VSQTSYPVVNVRHSGAQWRTVQDVGDGIVNDLDGSAYALTVTGTDTCTIGVGTYRVDGVVFEIASASETVTLAAVSTPTTYLIGIKVDFAAETSPTQLTLVAGVKATVLASLTGTERVVPLYEIDRSASTVLSASPRRDYRVWASEQAYAATLLAASADAPVGSVLRTPEGVRVRRIVSGVPVWASTDLIPLTAITYASGWESYPDSPAKAALTQDGRIVLSGLARRPTTAATLTLTGYTLSTIGYLPTGIRPTAIRYVAVGTGVGMFGLLVNTDGRLQLRSHAPLATTSYTIPAGSYVALDGITLEV